MESSQHPLQLYLARSQLAVRVFFVTPTIGIHLDMVHGLICFRNSQAFLSIETRKELFGRSSSHGCGSEKCLLSSIYIYILYIVLYIYTISHTLFPSTDFYCSQLGSHWASSGMSKSSTTTNKVELQDQKVTTSLEEIFCMIG